MRECFLDKGLKKLKQLRYLTLAGNPFVTADLKEVLFAHLPRLELLDSAGASGIEPVIVKTKEAFSPTTLEMLCYNVEAANSHPSFALDYLRDMAGDVDRLVDNLDSVDEYFAKGKSEREVVSVELVDFCAG